VCVCACVRACVRVCVCVSVVLNVHQYMMASYMCVAVLYAKDHRQSEAYLNPLWQTEKGWERVGGSRLRGGQHGQGLMFLEEGWSGGGWEGRAFSKVVHLCTCVRLCTHVRAFVYARLWMCVCVCVDLGCTNVFP